jgi:hypothetical protein
VAFGATRAVVPAGALAAAVAGTLGVAPGLAMAKWGRGRGSGTSLSGVAAMAVLDASANRLASAQAAFPLRPIRRVKLLPQPSGSNPLTNHPWFEPIKETLTRQSWQWFGRMWPVPDDNRFPGSRKGFDPAGENR